MARISKSGITNGGTIDSTHLTRIIEALDGTGSAAIYATGSFTGSFIGDGSQLTGIAGGGGTPGGSDTEIQYNNSNTFDGVPALTYAGSVLRATGSFSGSFRGQATATGSFSGSFRGQATATGSFSGSFIGTATATGSFTGSFRGQATATGSFTGSFVGDGSGLTGIAGGGGALTWSTISGSSPTATLAANNGYVMRDTTGFTSLTLPSSGVVIGDIIKIIATTEGGGGSLSNWEINEGRVNDVIFYSFFDHTAGEFTGVLNTNPLLTFDNSTPGSYTMYKNQSLTLTCIQNLGTAYAWSLELANGKLFA